ncbi:YgjV family protein [Paraglaciecola sp. 25GB23A]|uniref:YgjV family protein n=1 Tax=Paraglaciecola sp. 25GB23A TaxID=3156068 RepID=UPI0032AF3CEC
MELLDNYFKSIVLLFQEAPWAQTIGLVALVVGLSAFLQKSDYLLKRNLTIYTLLMGIQFLMLDLWASALAAWLGTFRTYVSMRSRSTAVMWSLIAIVLIFALPTVRSVTEVLPIIGNILGTWAMFKEQGLRMRALMFVGTLCWLTHNYLVGSIGGTVIEALFLVVNANTMYGFIRQELHESKKE